MKKYRVVYTCVTYVKAENEDEALCAAMDVPADELDFVDEYAEEVYSDVD